MRSVLVYTDVCLEHGDKADGMSRTPGLAAVDKFPGLTVIHRSWPDRLVGGDFG